MRLTDKVVIVTGAARGIGKAIAVRCAIRRAGGAQSSPPARSSSNAPPAPITSRTRRVEVQEKIASHSKAIRLFLEEEDYLQADAQREHQRAWQRILKEMDGLQEVALISPPVEGVLRRIGAGDLGEVLLTLVSANLDFAAISWARRHSLTTKYGVESAVRGK